MRFWLKLGSYMRREKLYLADIVEASDAIARFLTGVDNKAFLASDMIRSAVLQKLMVIGEAASKIPDTVRERHADVPWRRLVGLRNIGAHAYFTVRWETAWLVATEEVPLLRVKVAAILEAEYPGQE